MSRNQRPSNDEGSDDEKDLSTAIMVFAHYIGIDLDHESELLWVAEEAFDNLPDGWEVGIGEGEHAGIPFFYNSNTGESDWKHPDEQFYMKKVKKERQAMEEKRAKKGKGKEKKREEEEGGGLRVDVSASLNDSKAMKSTGKKGGGAKSAVREVAEVEEVMDVEEFEEVHRPKKDLTTDRRKEEPAPGTGKKKDRPGFGMTEDDFLDDPSTEREVRHSHPTSFSPERRDKDKEREREKERDRERDRERERERENKDKDYFSNKEGREREEARSASPDRARNNNNNNNTINNNNADDRWAPAREKKKERTDVIDQLEDFDDDRFDMTSERAPRRASGKPKDNKEAVKEVRERERDRDREVSAATSSSSSSSAEVERLSRQVSSLRSDYALLQDELAEVRQRLTQESVTQREEIRGLENKLFEERRENKTLSERLSQQLADHQRLLRESEERNELRLKEVTRKARQEADDDFREKLKAAERKHLEEEDALTREVTAARRKSDELQREIDVIKRRSVLSREESQSLFDNEVDEWKEKCRRAEEELLTLRGSDMRRLQDEVERLRQKHALAIQEIEKLTLDVGQARAAQKAVADEAAVKQTTFLTSLERAAKLDADVASLKAEVEALTRENQRLDVENRKIKSLQTMTHEQSSTSESELRRVKVTSQNETARLNSRILELEALNHVFKDQIDKQLRQDSQELKSLQLLNHSLEVENQRLKERGFEQAMKEEELLLRVRNQEKEMMSLQETLFKRDKLLADERQSKENITLSIQQIRRDYEKDLTQQREKVEEAVRAKEVQARKSEEEVAALSRDMAQRLPKLIQQSIQKHVAHFSSVVQQKEHALQQHYSALLQQREQDLAKVNLFYQEKEMQWKLSLKEEMYQKEHHLARYKEVLQEKESLEMILYEKKRQLQLIEYTTTTYPAPPNNNNNTNSYYPHNYNQNNNHNNNPNSNSNNNHVINGSHSNTQHTPPPQTTTTATTPPLNSTTSNVNNSSDTNSSMGMGIGMVDGFAKEAMELLTQQLTAMKQQISDTLHSQLQLQPQPQLTYNPNPNNTSYNNTSYNSYNGAPTMPNKENILPPASFEHVRETRSRDEVEEGGVGGGKVRKMGIASSNSRQSSEANSLQSILLDDESALFLSPTRPRHSNNNSYNNYSAYQRPPPPPTQYTSQPPLQPQSQSQPPPQRSFPSHHVTFDEGSLLEADVSSHRNRRSLEEYKGIYNSSYNTNTSLLNSSIELLDDVPSFDNLRDGGYYEGYWKAKYSKQLR